LVTTPRSQSADLARAGSGPNRCCRHGWARSHSGPPAHHEKLASAPPFRGRHDHPQRARRGAQANSHGRPPRNVRAASA